MFHKADEWGAKKAVIVGTALNPKDTLWGILEKQLKGKIEEFSDNITPGKEAIKRFLSEYQPLLILMDEVLEYATKSAGVKVGASNLASQTIAFMQELTEVVSTLKNTCLVITLPSSIIEHYDQSAERLFQQLQKVAGRMEKIYTPVQEYEITKIIRRRGGMGLKGAKLYTTTYPCPLCAKKIVQVGIEEVIFDDPYPTDLSEIFLQEGKRKVKLRHFEGVKPLGYFKLFKPDYDQKEWQYFEVYNLVERFKYE